MLSSQSRSSLLGAFAVLLLIGCASPYGINAPLTKWDPSAEQVLPHSSHASADEMLLVVAFSGGGTRAAAFAYGVLKELNRMEIDIDGTTHRLINEVDIASGVSGGSFTAAYFGLHGQDIFDEYEERFLRRNVQRGILLQLLRPYNWGRLFRTDFDRSELAAEYYDRYIFDGATFGDLTHGKGPAVVINATDLSKGIRFAFTQAMFDFICSDLSTFPISRAVAASSAVPVLLTPVALKNYAGSCGFEAPDWMQQALSGDDSVRMQAEARRLGSYLDADRRRYIHLVDGGITDNLGIRGLVSNVVAGDDVAATIRKLVPRRLRRVVVILVNAETDPDTGWDLSQVAPSLADIVNAVTGTQIRRFNLETIDLVRTSFKEVVRKLSTPQHPVSFHLVEVSFDAIQDDKERRWFNRLPTSFALSDEQVDKLIEAGGRLLRESKEYQALLAESHHWKRLDTE